MDAFEFHFSLFLHLGTKMRKSEIVDFSLHCHFLVHFWLQVAPKVAPWEPFWNLSHYFGNHFDIHCGGIDNKFPHHENEIAQSVCAFNEPFVNYWLHSEFLLVEDQKMSKSLKNYYILSDLFDCQKTPTFILQQNFIYMLYILH